MIRDRLAKWLENPKLDAAIDALVADNPGYDAWGFNPAEIRPFTKLAYFLYRYFHPEIRGIENIPEGRVLLVPNHSGQLPMDGLVVGMACVLEGKPPRLARAMAERWFPTLPFINVMFSRSGVVVGDPINCRNLLEQENAILVFPEGARGSGKTWDHRYRLVPFGRGFMRLALQTNAPIVPVSVVGAEESIVSVHNAKTLADLLGTPYFPIHPLLPILGPLAYIPLPTKFYIDFGEPMHFEGPFDDEDEVIDKKVRDVMDRIQSMIDHRRQERPSIF
ncbi:MAG: lysophospholipid acyltransferase family protein [Deltaproteobacteria bacterium]|jgi:1-acyl-sn-glycerol-3-phosphate acyltransferase